jgi:hypothetical protein
MLALQTAHPGEGLAGGWWIQLALTRPLSTERVSTADAIQLP